MFFFPWTRKNNQPRTFSFFCLQNSVTICWALNDDNKTESVWNGHSSVCSLRCDLLPLNKLRTVAFRRTPPHLIFSQSLHVWYYPLVLCWRVFCLLIPPSLDKWQSSEWKSNLVCWGFFKFYRVGGLDWWFVNSRSPTIGLTSPWFLNCGSLKLGSGLIIFYYWHWTNLAPENFGTSPPCRCCICPVNDNLKKSPESFATIFLIKYPNGKGLQGILSGSLITDNVKWDRRIFLYVGYGSQISDHTSTSLK